MTIDVRIEFQLDLELLEELVEPDLRWREEGMAGYLPLTSWMELDLLLSRLGIGGPDFLVVESLATSRFAQTWGDPKALIIEVCDNAGTFYPDVWRLRRAPGDRLPNSELGALLFEIGGVGAEHLFTVEEAARVFREFLRGGGVSGVELERVEY